MGKFDAGQGNGRASERLEASHHRGASAFDRSMILLNEIVEVWQKLNFGFAGARVVAGYGNSMVAPRRLYGRTIDCTEYRHSRLRNASAPPSRILQACSLIPVPFSWLFSRE
jgi:hypothetical protein